MSRSAASRSPPKRIATLAAELGVGAFPTHDEGRHLIEMAGKPTSFTGALTDARLGLLRDLTRGISPLALIDFEQVRVRLDWMARRVPLGSRGWRRRR